jgi:hypothetical protein
MAAIDSVLLEVPDAAAAEPFHTAAFRVGVRAADAVPVGGRVGPGRVTFRPDPASVR